MREFKFRAWHKEDEEMVYYGQEELFNNHNWLAIHFNGEFNDKDWQQHGILMQYTGLNDWKGEEIYEGDIIRINNNSSDPIGAVIFVMGAFMLETSYMITTIDHEMAEILGNIYENPELMEK